MSEFARYQAYKDSGVEWLGEIPEHWGIKRFRYCYTSSNAGAVIDKSHWNHGDEILYTCKRTPLKSSYSKFENQRKTDNNDLLVTRNGTPYVHFPVINAIYSNVVQCVKISADLDRKFVWYALSNSCLYLSGYGDIIESFNMSTWNELFIPIPDLIEQNKIVTFLDQKTTEIDEAIAKKQRLIELLKEQKAILINQAVTKGLNPNVPMRNSGVEWIGEIPAHWQVKKLKLLVKFYSGATPSKDNLDFWDGDISWVSPKDMKKKYISDSIDSITAQAVKKTGIKILPIGTVLIVVRGMILAKKIPVAITTSELTINQDMKGLITNSWCDSEYLMYLLDGLHEELSTILEESGHGTKTMPTPKLANFELQIPSLDEQKAIVSAIAKAV